MVEWMIIAQIDIGTLRLSHAALAAPIRAHTKIKFALFRANNEMENITFVMSRYRKANIEPLYDCWPNEPVEAESMEGMNFM